MKELKPEQQTTLGEDRQRGRCGRDDSDINYDSRPKTKKKRKKKKKEKGSQVWLGDGGLPVPPTPSCPFHFSHPSLRLQETKLSHRFYFVVCTEPVSVCLCVSERWKARELTWSGEGDPGPAWMTGSGPGAWARGRGEWTREEKSFEFFLSQS